MKKSFIYFVLILSVACTVESDSDINTLEKSESLEVVLEPTIEKPNFAISNPDFYAKYPLILPAERTFQNKQYDSSIFYCNIAEEVYGNMIVLYEKRGLAYSRSGRFTLALEQFNKIIYGGTGYGSCLNNRGMVYYKQGQFKLALDDFFRIAEEFPQEYSVYVNIGNCYSKRKEMDQACKYWDIAFQNGYDTNEELISSRDSHCK